MTGLLAQHGLALVFANVMLAQLGVPLPAVPVLVLAGAFVAQGNLDLAPLLVVTIVASLLGDMPWYLAGRRHGYSILRTLCRIAIEPDSCVKQTENVFLRWGPAALIVAKYIPGFATVAPPLAGTMILDARSALARKYDPRRLPGAIVVNIDSPQAALVAVPPDRDVVVYCS